MRKICRGIGDEGVKRLNASRLSEENKKKLEELWKFFEGQLKMNVNFRIHRLHLMQYRQRPEENIDDFMTKARTLALKCQFTDEELNELNERLIELIIASTPHDALRNDLYSKPQGYSLADVLTEGGKYEALSAGNEQLNQLGLTTAEKVHAIFRGRTCQNYGRSHQPRQCPAYNDECSACGAKGHWARCCRNNRRQQKLDPTPCRRSKSHPPPKKHYKLNQTTKGRYKTQHKARVDVVDCEKPEEEYVYKQQFHSITLSEKCMHSINNNPPRDEAYTTLNVRPPTYQAMDTLHLGTFKQMYGSNTSTYKRLKKNNTKLSAYSGHEIPCYGTINIQCQYKDSRWVSAKFYVVDVPGPAVVGLPTSELLNLVTLHVDAVKQKADNSKENRQQTKQRITNCNDLIQAYPNQFDHVGNFKGTAKLILKPDAEPFIDPPRKCSIHIKDKLQDELNKLVAQDVLRKVEHHTDWCSSLALSTKKDRTLRICLDLQKLNASLKRCSHKIPSVEELNPRFANAKIFSKLDAKAGYWSIHLDEESQILTTFRTPFGRYCWKRFPFGLSVSQDLFQAKMDQILEGLHGVASIADNIVVYGKDEEEHDRNLTALMKRAAEAGMVVNSDKCIIKQNNISFFGNVYTDSGIKPDPAKIRDIQKNANTTEQR